MISSPRLPIKSCPHSPWPGKISPPPSTLNAYGRYYDPEVDGVGGGGRAVMHTFETKRADAERDARAASAGAGGAAARASKVDDDRYAAKVSRGGGGGGGGGSSKAGK